MRLFCVLLFLIGLIPFSKGQNPLEVLLLNERFEVGKKYLNQNVTKKNNRTGKKYTFIKFPDNVSLDSNKRIKHHFAESGVIMFPVLAQKTILDTITFELEYNIDSTTCHAKNIHSIKPFSYNFIYLSVENKNCFSYLDSLNGYKVYQLGYHKEIVPLTNIAFTSRNTCKDFGDNLSSKVIIEEYTYHYQPELKWIPIEEWDSTGKIKMETGIMNNTYRDEAGNKYLLIEEGYYSDIREVLCSIHKVRGTTMELQQALKDKGYDVEVNNIMCDKTKDTLFQFQKDNNLPQGNLNIETLRALDLMY